MTTEKKYKWSQQKEDRAINREIIDDFIECKHCTMLTNPNYDCGKLKGYDLVKGKEPQCHCPDFINCPAFNQYMNHEILRRRRKVKTEKEEIESEMNNQSNKQQNG